MLERMDPKTMIKWLIFLGIAYLLLPFDLLPDFLGVPGRIDDIVMIGLLAWYYRNHRQQFAARGSGQQAEGASAGPEQGSQAPPQRPESFDPYEVLGVTRSASIAEIQAAYRARMKEYHPDKVAHLGRELQQLAHVKAQDIQRAYQQLHR